MTVTSTDRNAQLNSSLAIKAPVRGSTTANIALAGLQTTDGVAGAAGDRWLVGNQTDATQNGIYTQNTGTWVRETDFQGTNNVVTGTMVKVNEGTANKGFWYVSTTGTITPGTTAISFAQASTIFAAITAFAQALLANATAGAALTTLGMSSYFQTLINAADVATLLANIGTTEVVFNQPGDFSRNNRIYGIPQFPWSAPVKLTDPGTLPKNAVLGAAFSPNGEFLAASHGDAFSARFISIYERSGATLTFIGDPSVQPFGTASACAWSANGEWLAVATATSPYIFLYQRTDDNTFVGASNGPPVSEAAYPITALAGQALACAFSPNGEFLAVAHAISPFVSILQRSNGNFTKLADPATLPASTGNAVAWSSDGQFLAVGHNNAPFVTIYQRAGSTFTKVADPNTLPASAGLGCAFSLNGSFLAVAHGTTPFVSVYQRAGATFTKITDPINLPAGSGNACAWSPNGGYLAVAHTNSPFVTVYSLSGSTLTRLADPATLPAGIGTSVAWSPDNQFLCVGHGTSPFMTVYQTASDMPATAVLKMQKQLRAGQ